MRRRAFLETAISAAAGLLLPRHLRALEAHRMASDTPTSAKLEPFMPRKYNVSHLMCLHACIDQVGIEVDAPWLFGTTGYAFMMNLSTGAMVAGPTWWNFASVLPRTMNMGIDCSEYVYSRYGDPDFSEKKEKAIALVKRSWDEGIPAYSAEFGFPEFFTIAGYSEEGVFGNSWCYRDGKPRLFTWDSLGVADAGVLIVSTARKADSRPDDAKAIRDALLFAVEVGHAEQGYLDGDAVGLRAYDAWIDKLQEQLRMGSRKHPNNADHHTENWWECRHYAPQFLQQASEKTRGNLSRDLRGAAEQYSKVLEAWDSVRKLCHYWMKPEEHTRESLTQTVAHLEAAKEAESKGLEMLEMIAKSL